MSVIVKGVNIPKNCLECKFTDSEWGVCVLDQPNERAPEDYMKRSDWCPLTQIPPHGDLIDRREAIIDANERAYDFWLSDDEVNATIQFLKEQPTIIPADPAEEGD